MSLFLGHFAGKVFVYVFMGKYLSYNIQFADNNTVIVHIGFKSICWSFVILFDLLLMGVTNSAKYLFSSCMVFDLFFMVSILAS